MLLELPCNLCHKNKVCNLIGGSIAAEVEIDLLSGNLQLTRVDILEDCGESMSPGIDLGQVEGAFVMGMGYRLTESLVYGRDNMELLTDRTSTYNPPGAKDIPIDFRVTFLRNSSNTGGVLRSKATGEPGVHEGRCYFCASARVGITNEWFEMGAPSTPDIIFLKAGHSLEQFKLK